MAARKDQYGRVLNKGEVQRKDGYYQYAYLLDSGKRNYVYGKTLAELRVKEEIIQRDLLDGIDTLKTNKLTVDNLFWMYMQNKRKLSISTRVNYEYLYLQYVKNRIGDKKVSAVKYTTVLGMFNQLLETLSYGTIRIIYSFLRPMFDLCVADDLLRKNPMTGVLKELRNEYDLKVGKRSAMSITEQYAFMHCIEDTKKFRKYYNLFVFFLGTGARAGEVLGLTWKDVDFNNNMISINHTLSYLKNEENRCVFHCGPTKTASSVRQIPMFTEVKMALLREKNEQKARPCVAEIDGYRDFVFTNSKGYPFHPCEINRLMNKIIDEHNAHNVLNIRHFSMHNLRHTFATNLCMSEDNIKVIQTIMGHSNINVTMNVYAECTSDKMQNVVKKLDGKIAIGMP